MKTLNKNTKNRTIMKYHTVTSLKLIITLVFLCGISIKGWTQETSLSATDENGLTWTFKTNLSTSNSFYHKAYDVIPADASLLIGAIEVPCSLEVNGVSYPVLRMGSKAFNGCTQMTSLTLPKTVNSLYSKYMIFDGCTGLKKLDLSKISISSFPTRWFASDQANTQAVGLEEIWLPKVTARNPYTVNLFQYQTFKKVYFHEDQPKCTSSCFSALAALTGTVKNCVFYFPNEEVMNSFKAAGYWKDLLGNNNSQGNTCEVFTPVKEPESPVMKFTPNTLTVQYGEPVTAPSLSITRDGNTVSATVSYSVNEEGQNVASVNAETGALTILGTGAATVTASFAGDEQQYLLPDSASYTLTVTKRPAGLAFSAESYEAALGLTTDDLLPKLQNPHSLTVTYASSNTDIAEVAADGTVTLKAIGEADITATTEGSATEDGGSASYHLIVNAPTSGLSVSAETATLTYGASTEALPMFGNPNNLPLTYSSSDQTVATISSEGVVTLVGAGSTVISAHFAGNSVLPNAEELSYTLTVSRRAGALAFEGDSEILLYMDTEPAASVFPVLQNPNNVAVTYTSSDESVVTVDAATGAVTRVGVGTATITATAAETATDEASTASYSVTVYAEAVMYLVDEAGVEWKVKIEDADQMLLIPVDLTQETYTIYNKVTEKGTDHEYVVKGLKEGVFTGINTVKTVDLSRVENLVTEGMRFRNQTSVEQITLPDTVSFNRVDTLHFAGCSSLQEITLPEGIERLYERTFENCTSLRKATLPVSLTHLGASFKNYAQKGVFENCMALKEIVIPEDNHIEGLGRYALGRCGIERIVLPIHMASLGKNNYLLQGDPYLKEIDLTGATITILAGYCFSNENGLPVEDLKLPTTLQSIEGYSLTGLSNLKQLDLPEGLTSLASSSLSGLNSLEVLNLPSPLETIADIFTTGSKAHLKEINFAEGRYENLTLTGSYFTNFPALESIVLPDCKSISGYTLLKGCTNLKAVYLRFDPSKFEVATGCTGQSVPFYNVKNCAFFVDSEKTYQAFMDYTFPEDAGDWSGQKAWAQFDAANNEVGNHYEFPYQPGLHFDGEEMTAYVGQADVAGLPVLNNHNLTDLALAYSSSNSEVATVDATTGAITPVGEGDATITVSFEGDAARALLADEASYTLHVLKVAAGLAYSKDEITCTYGEDVEWPVLSNEYNFPVTYSSSDETVATVDGEGVVTFTGIGTTIITATCNTVDPVETAQFTLNVSKGSIEMAYSAAEAKALIGFTAIEELPQLTINGKAQEVIFTSSNPAVASISAEGVVTLNGAGESEIKATVPGTVAYDGKEASYQLTVDTKAGIAFYWDNLKDAFGDEDLRFNAINTAYYYLPFANPYGVDVTYSVSDADILKIETGAEYTNNEMFSVTVLKPGEADIIATYAGNGIVPAETVTMHVKVLKAQYEASFDKDEVTAYLDYAEERGLDKTTVYPVLNVESENVKGIKYSSSNKNVFHIDTSGTTKLLFDVGTAIVTATLPETDFYEKATFSYTVHVDWEPHDIVVGSTGYATYCCKSGLTFENRDDDLEAFVVSSFGDGNVKLVKVNHVMPRTPLLIKATPGTYTVEHDQNMKQYANLLKGTLEPTYVTPTEGIYTNMVLSKGEDGAVGFHPLKAAGEIGAWKAYLQVETEVVEAYSGFLGLSFEDETTGVNSVRELPSDGNWYTLQGVRIEKPTQPGIYVRNGKKVSLSWKDVENIKD